VLKIRRAIAAAVVTLGAVSCLHGVGVSGGADGVHAARHVMSASVNTGSGPLMAASVNTGSGPLVASVNTGSGPLMARSVNTGSGPLVG
jgi:hypothetical protein